MTMVARLGEKAPTGRLLAAVGALKFGFGALLATFWATFSVTGFLWAIYKRYKLGYFSPVLAP